MKLLHCILGALLTVGILSSCSHLTGDGPDSAENAKKKVLVFSKTAGYRHGSIKAGKVALKKLGLENGFGVEFTEDAAEFTDTNLSQFSSVIFLSTTGDVLYPYQQMAFERFIQAGGGYVGVHSATDTEYQWPWYGKLAGGYFAGHPRTQPAMLKVHDNTHPSSAHLGEEWLRTDEWYNFKSLNPDVNVLLSLDESTYEGGKNADNHPIAWYHDYDGGHAFYTGGGHTNESFKEPEFLQHLLGGILYSMGDSAGLDYTKVHTKAPVETNRLVPTVLESGLSQPMELEVLSDGRVLYIERRGQVRLYEPEQQGARTLATIPVKHVKEDGLLGMAVDPNFDQNGWVYFYYSAQGDKIEQHLSRFTFLDGEMNLDSEKVMLIIPVQHGEACCHSGGSLEFGPEGNLFVSIGDNTNPFKSKGFSPVDEREGRDPWDAQRSAGNSNDLRGSVLRIRPEADGTYSIPEGNLFPEGTAKARPEIYIMGNRNPFRLSVDQHTGFLYWGEVGPDSGQDNKDFGPRGHDEINQAREAGFFGWPYFIGDNKPYQKYDFVNESIGKHYNDVTKPVNTSPHNTGVEDLPAPMPAFIWYPAAKNKEFPEVGFGGRTAMAGPVFYSSDFAQSEGKFPEYFDRKLFIYEWSRNWIKVVSLDENGQYESMEPFMPEHEFLRPVDMQFAKDGSLYVLIYGKTWGDNADSELLHIKYQRGNRPPQAQISANTLTGVVPLDVKFSAKESSDVDGDALSYEWAVDGKVLTQKNETLDYRFENTGVHQLALTVRDESGESSTKTVEVGVGNEQPELSLTLKSRNGNSMFYWPDIAIDYQVQVSDKEDGSLKDGGIKADDVHVSSEYFAKGKIPESLQTSGVSQKHAQGKKDIKSHSCTACHAIDSVSVGPSFKAVAKRYREADDHTLSQLHKKVREGGSGNWGEHAMPANPYSKEKIEGMVAYIRSLAEPQQRLPVVGQFTPAEGGLTQRQGAYVLQATYQDKGGDALPLTASSRIVLRSSLPAINYDGIHKARSNENNVGWTKNSSHIFFKKIDLNGIEKLRYSFASKGKKGRIEVHQGAADGPLLSSVDFNGTGGWGDYQDLTAELAKTSGSHDLYFVFFERGEITKDGLINLKNIQFIPSHKAVIASH